MKNPLKWEVTVLSLALMLIGAKWASAEIPLQQTDHEILSVLSIIDQNEIQVAQLAEGKNIDHRVIDLAQMMDHQHSEHLEKIRQITQELNMTAADNQTVEDLRAQGQKDLAALTPLDGTPFAQLYVADMVKGHSEALNWIDRQNTSNDKIKAFLKKTRDVVAMHFKKAQELQEALTGTT